MSNDKTEERAAFEAWYASLPNNGRKAGLTLLDAWIASRAALSSRPVQGGDCDLSPTEAVQDFPRTVENLTVECESLRKERDWYKQRARMQAEHQRGEVWYWQNDGEDHLESLVSSLPVVILAGHLRELLALSSAPAQPVREPMTEREILDLVPTLMPIGSDFELLWFARAIERHHGITKE